jgi:hypothetical protein
MNKITDNELERIKFIKKDSLEVASVLGELQYQKMVIDLLIDEEKQKIKSIKSTEKQLLQELTDKYGSININLETGEYS